jgi:hypothetical protein
MLNDYAALYQLDEAPYTRYQTDGSTLFAITQTASTVASLINAQGLVSTATYTAGVGGLQTQINAVSALIGTGLSPSKPTISTAVAFAGALSANVEQSITPAKWSGATVTISNATPAVVTWASHGLSINADIIFNTTGGLPTGLTVGTTYYVIASGFTSGSFQVSATQGGSAINTSSAGSGTHTVMGIVPSSRVWHVYENNIIDSFPNRTVPLYTPDTGAAGLPAYVVEDALARNGSGVVQSTSAVVVVAAPASFSATLAQAVISGTANQAITSVAPVVFTGNVGSVTVTISPSLSGTGLSLNSTSGIISGTPTAALTGRYTVTGTDSNAPTFPISLGFDFNIAAAAVVPLSTLPFPSGANVTGTSGNYDGATAKIVSGTTRLGPIVDATGVTMDIHRIVQQGSTEERAEALWTDPNYTQLICQHEYWLGVVVERLPGEDQTVQSTYDELLVLQFHWSGYGATQPELALYDFGYYDGSNTDFFRWRASGSSTTPGNYADHGGTGTFNWHDTGEAGYTNPWITDNETRPAVGVKWRYIIQYKPGWTAGHDKILRIYRGKPGLAMENITTGGVYTGVNEYNDNNNGLTLPAYPRKGLYKFSGSAWPRSTLGYKISRIYFGEGTNLLDRATAALDWAK